jgi:hypothetical protein
MANQTPVPDPYCPQCGQEFESIWVVQVNKGALPEGFSHIFTPEQRDVAQCHRCEASFERTNGEPWHRQEDAR